MSEGSLTFREFAVREPLPLATLHEAILSLLRGREDAVLFGAQAVNAYVDEPRMTQDVDVLSTRAPELAEELRRSLGQQFHIAVRVREVKAERGYRIYQLREPKNRHLADVRAVDELPPSRRVEGVLVLAPEALVASKVVAYEQRRGRPKAFTDRRDIAVLLLAFPDLKREPGPVGDHLRELGASAAVLQAWSEIVRQPISPDADDGY